MRISQSEYAARQLLHDQVVLQTSKCYRCPIREIGQPIVMHKGPLDAELVILGEAPGYNESIDGIPFTGRAGRLLDRMIIRGMGMSPDEVYFANVLKCRPPENRNPLSEEIHNCEPFLLSQLTVVQPKVVLTVGKYASALLRAMDPETTTMTSMRTGGSLPYTANYATLGFQVVSTWHPAYILRNPDKKGEVQQDLNSVLKILDKPIIANEHSFSSI